MDRLQILNDRKAQVLEHLGRFTYLTVNQLVDLGIAPQARNVRDRYLRPLTEGRYPLVGFGSFYVSNRPLPRIYYLTKRGVRALAEYWDVVPETIYFPTGKIQFTRDYDHRVATVDCLISLYQWTKKQGHEIDFCDTYFQVDGSQRKQGQQLTRRPQVSLEGTTVIPDANFRLNMSDGQQRLFTLELHRQPKTQRIVEQLEVHADIIRHELLAKKYDSSAPELHSLDPLPTGKPQIRNEGHPEIQRI